jgi:hypothetical protein
MKKLHVPFTIILALALLASIVGWRVRDLQLERQIQTLTDANNVLRQTLGELTIEITKKEREIDELRANSNSSVRRNPSQKKQVSAAHL